MLSVKINNIGGLQDINEFKFDKGLNIIKAPNASGKSSLINAFKLSFNGPDFSNLKNINEYLSDFKDSGTINIDLDGNSIKLILERGKDGIVKVIDYVSSISFFDNRLLKLVFFDQFSEIYQTIITGNTEKFKEWISNITDIKLYQIAVDLVDIKENELKNQLLRLTEQDLGKKETFETQLNAYKKELKKFESEREKILQSSKDVELKSTLHDVIGDHDKLEKQLKQLKETKTSKAQTLERENKERKNLQDKFKQKSSEFELTKRELLEIEGKLEELNNNLDKSTKENENLHTELEGTVKEVQGKKRTVEGLRKKLENKEKRRENQRSLFAYLECPTCYRPLDQNKLKVDVQALDKEIRELSQEIEKKEIILNKNKKEIKNLQAQIEKANTELPNKKRALDIEIKNIQKDIDGMEKKITKIDNEFPEIEARIKESEEKFKVIKSKKQELESNLKKEDAKYNELDQKIDDRKEEINLSEAQLKKITQETEAVQKLRKKVQATAEIKNHFQKVIELIRNDIIGVINNEILNSFKLLELAELNYLSIEAGTFELEIRRKLGRKTGLLELSAAERTLVALIIIYVTKRVLLPKVPIFFMDETSNAFDDTRFQRIIEYLAQNIDTLVVTKNEPFQGKRGEILTQENIVHNF